jgi:PTH1 family peptidyl-tRNA hydrolase
MNLSGQAVLAVMRKYKLPAENLIVITDDLHIEKGNIRVSFGGSGGGHNGLRSITELLGTAQYTRIRVGIMPEKEPHSQANYVLSKIDKASRELVDRAIEKAVDCAMKLSQGEKIETLQGRYNVKNAKNSAQ